MSLAGLDRVSRKRRADSPLRGPNKRFRYDEISCPIHPEAHLVEDYHAGDMICPECGLVVGDRLVDVGSEWRTFADSSGGDPSRVGAAQDPLFEENLSTVIGPMHGKNILGGDGTLSRGSLAVSSGDQTLRRGFDFISQMAARLQVPNGQKDRAKSLFSSVHENKEIKGRTCETVAAACLFIACRLEGAPRTFKEFVRVTEISKKELGRTFKMIVRSHELDVDQAVTDDYMDRFCANLFLADPIRRVAKHIANKTIELDLCPGRVHTSIAAAAIYMATMLSPDKNFQRSQKEIGEAVRVADVTIRQAYRLMYPRRNELLPKDVGHQLRQ